MNRGIMIASGVSKSDVDTIVRDLQAIALEAQGNLTGTTGTRTTRPAKKPRG